MRIVGVIQARMGSKRLPGKVMADICGKPLIRYVMERVDKARQLDDWCVAIPNNDIGSELHEYCEKFGAPVFMGSEDDVAGRMIWTASQMRADYMVRICADSPLVDPIQIDLVAGLAPCSYGHNFFDDAPHGTAVQIYYLPDLKAEYLVMDRDSKEHVRPNGLACSSLNGPPAGFHMTVDTQSDLDFIRHVVGKMDRAHWTYDWAACQKIASQLS